jgi:hypothetical protein
LRRGNAAESYSDLVRDLNGTMAHVAILQASLHTKSLLKIARYEAQLPRPAKYAAMFAAHTKASLERKSDWGKVTKGHSRSNLAQVVSSKGVRTRF